MKISLLKIIGIIVAFVVTFVILSNFHIHQEAFALFLCDKWFFSDIYTCTKLWEDPDCHRPGSGCIFPEKTPFEKFIEKKAISAFNLKLKQYRIDSEIHSVNPTVTTGNFQTFLAQTSDNNGTQYYLKTSFDPDESLDKINVEIYQIVSGTCDYDLVFSGDECNLQLLEKPERDYSGWELGNEN